MSLYYCRVDGLHVSLNGVLVNCVGVSGDSGGVVASIVEGGLFHEACVIWLGGEVVQRVCGVLGFLSCLRGV